MSNLRFNTSKYLDDSITLASRHFLPLLLPVFVFAAVLGAFLYMSSQANGGHIGYTVDDPYIHMSIAQNFAERGVWGVNPTEFSSSSSSPLWTLSISAIYFLFGVTELLPLVLNAVLAIIAIVLMYCFLIRFDVPRIVSAMLVTAIIFSIPLPTLVMSGHEHVLHIILVITFVLLVLKRLTGTGSVEYRWFTRSDLPLFAVALVLTATRYESLFLLGIVAILLALRNQWRLALLILISGLVSPVVYGAISLSQGWEWAPTSVTVNGHLLGGSSLMEIANSLGFRGLKEIVISGGATRLSIFLATTATFVFTVRSGRDIWDARRIVLLIFVVIYFLQFQIAQGEGFDRRVGFLRAFGPLVLAATFFHREVLRRELSRIQRAFWSEPIDLIKYAMVLLLVVVFVSGYGSKSLLKMKQTVDATSDIYEQQYQMGRFVRTYYDDSVIAVNDIGAVSFLSDAEIVDMYGLATRGVTSVIYSPGYGTQVVGNITEPREVEIVIIYASIVLADKYGVVFPPPLGWQQAGTWTLPRERSSAAMPTITFFSTDPSAHEKLVDNLRQFSTEIPARIIQKGEYVGP